MELAGVTARQLQWWDERRIVVPARQGRNRLYSATDLLDILVIEQLRRRRISLVQVRRVLRFLRTELHARLADLVTGTHEFHLLLDGRRIYLETESKQIVDLLRNARQPMLLVCLTDAVKPLCVELKDLVSRLPEKKPSGRTTQKAEKNRRQDTRRATA
ncbi:MAG TPA: MerR family transcriptional regulator [Terriglobales bacterium]